MISRIFVIMLSLGAGYLALEAFWFLSAGPGQVKDQVIFEVRPGTSFTQVAENLKSQGLVFSATKVRIFARLRGSDQKIKVGEYRLNKAMPPQEILENLVHGKSIQYDVTFPEGSNVFEMAQTLEAKGLFKAKDFIEACRDPKLIQDLLGIEVSSLEGYLFPETYKLTKYTELKTFIRGMVSNFKQVYSSLEAQAKNTGGLTRHELVTLASMVEKETGAPEERKRIASVFYNRLSKKMRLQSDPTIIYGLWVQTGKYQENIRKSDITRPTKYNTYTVPRLPFGPIANPGKEALAAVFNPEHTDYLYFVSRNDGTHVFTTSYQDHNKAVREFQLNPEARKGKSWRDINKQ